MAVARTRILGVGKAVPERVVTNDDLAKVIDTTDEWIQQRTGIRQRHHIASDCGATDLGKLAADEALLIFATLSPDIDWPSCACLLTAKLGARNIPAFDVKNQCSGFIYSLACADAMIRAGRARHVLVVGGEIHSTGLDLTTRGREVGVIFGDGAGAVVLGPSQDPERGLLSTHLHAEGKFAEKLWLEAAASRNRPRIKPEDMGGENPSAFPRMSGKFVFKHAVTRFPEVIREAFEFNGLDIAELGLLIPHQANLLTTFDSSLPGWSSTSRRWSTTSSATATPRRRRSRWRSTKRWPTAACTTVSWCVWPRSAQGSPGARHCSAGEHGAARRRVRATGDDARRSRPGRRDRGGRVPGAMVRGGVPA